MREVSASRAPVVMLFVSLWVGATALLVSCTGESPFTESAPLDFSNYIVVSTVRSAPSSGPGIVTLFDPTGEVVRVLQDYYETAEWVGGLAFFRDNVILASVNGTDRIEAISLESGIAESFAAHAQINSNYIRQIVNIPADGSTWILESGADDIEKVDVNGDRAGNPFISPTTGGCTLDDPWGVVYISSISAVGVISRASGGMYSVFDLAGSCLYQVTGAPFNAGGVTGIAYHEETNKILVTFSTSDEIWGLDPDGTNPVLAYLNTAVIDTPRAVTVDHNGSVYIGTDVMDTVEKFTFDGSTLTRATSGPLIGPGIYSQNPSSIMVVP